MKKKIKVKVSQREQYPFGGEVGTKAQDWFKNYSADLKSSFGGIANLLGPIGTVFNLTTGVMGMINQKKAADEQARLVEEDRMKQAQNFGGMAQTGAFNPYQATFPYGGMVPGMTPVELEKQEVFQTPDGQMGMVDGPSHEQGGVDMDLPGGTFVWSDKLKSASGRTFAEEAAYLGKLKAKYEKIVNNK